MRCNFALLALPLLLACPGSNISTSNNLPELVIQEPVDGSVHSASEGVLLRGRAMDSGAGGGIVEIAWTSDLSGVLFEGPPDDDDGNTLFTWTEAEAGVHVLTLRAIDTGGASVQESISITVVDNLPPVIGFCELVHRH